MALGVSNLRCLPLEERYPHWVNRLIITETNCALWPVVAKTGYAMAVVNGRSHRLHRLFYEHFRGEIPDGMEIHHDCRTRHCLNPWHMELLTADEHRRLHYPERTAVFQPKSRSATHCKYGHPFDIFDSNQKRCSICRKRHSREQWARIKAGRS